MDQFTGLIVLGVAAIIVLGLLWYVVTRFLVNIGAKEVGIKERRYFGRRMPQGRVVATDGERPAGGYLKTRTPLCDVPSRACGSKGAAR